MLTRFAVDAPNAVASTRTFESLRSNNEGHLWESRSRWGLRSRKDLDLLVIVYFPYLCLFLLFFFWFYEAVIVWMVRFLFIFCSLDYFSSLNFKKNVNWKYGF